MIAALYVQADGCYTNLPGVDPWPEARDARHYPGPWPVVAHPPCERWGRYWGGSPTTWPRKIKGDDNGCFAAALAAVRRWGGVLEHPADSAAWDAFGLLAPPRTGGWIRADAMYGFGGWTCCVEQGAYGHKARKGTWLYACSTDLLSLAWGRAPGEFVQFEDGFHSAEERRLAKACATKQGVIQRLSHRQRAATPIPFRDLLLSIARSHQIAPATPAWGHEAGRPAVSSQTRSAALPGCAPSFCGWSAKVCTVCTDRSNCPSTRQTMEQTECQTQRNGTVQVSW